MRSNIDETLSAIESLEQTESVHIDGDQSEAILRAIVDDGMDDFEAAIESMPSVSIETVTGTPYGLEVTLR